MVQELSATTAALLIRVDKQGLQGRVTQRHEANGGAAVLEDPNLVLRTVVKPPKALQAGLKRVVRSPNHDDVARTVGLGEPFRTGAATNLEVLIGLAPQLPVPSAVVVVSAHDGEEGASAVLRSQALRARTALSLNPRRSTRLSGSDLASGWNVVCSRRRHAWPWFYGIVKGLCVLCAWRLVTLRA